MPIEAVLMAVILLLVLAVLVCIGVIYRMGRAGTTVSPILDQRLLSIEGSISRSDSAIREEFGRGRDETRDPRHGCHPLESRSAGGVSPPTLRGSKARAYGSSIVSRSCAPSGVPDRRR